jgi:hypothetical protein
MSANEFGIVAAIGIPVGLFLLEALFREMITRSIERHVSSSYEHSNYYLSMILGVKPPLGMTAAFTAIVLISTFPGLGVIGLGAMFMHNAVRWLIVVMFFLVVAVAICVTTIYWRGTWARIRCFEEVEETWKETVDCIRTDPNMQTRTTYVAQTAELERDNQLPERLMAGMCGAASLILAILVCWAVVYL